MNDNVSVQPNDESIWQQIYAFVISVVGGGRAQVKINVGITLPKFSISESVQVFTTKETITLGASGDDTYLRLECKPS